MTPAGIEPATFRFVAQHVNHCAAVVSTYLLFNPLNNQVRAENSFPFSDSVFHKISLAALSKASPVYLLTGFHIIKKEFKHLTFVYIIHLHKYSVPASDRTQSVFLKRMIFVV